MATIAQLRSEATSLRQKAQSHNEQSNKALSRASSYTAAGDPQRAIIESDVATKERQSAHDLDQQASVLERQALDAETQALSIQEQQNTIITSAQNEVERLEAIKKSIQG
jgi:hypothetical protein